MWIKGNAFFIEVTPEQYHCLLCKTDRFDSPPRTAFTERLRFVFCPQRCPIREHQSDHFGHSCAGFKEEPGHDFIAQPCQLEREALPSFQNISRQFGIINDLWFPLVMFS